VPVRKVAVIGGDGIGPEVIGAAVQVLEAVGAPLELVPAEMGAKCHSLRGSYLPEATIDVLEGTDCCLFGAITSPAQNTPGYLSPLLEVRRRFDLYANVRPSKRLHPRLGLVDLDVIIVRENTEGMYTGLERDIEGGVVLDRVVTEKACRRLVRFSIGLCRHNSIKSITCVHKANVLRRSDGLFRRVFFEEIAGSGLEANELLVDAAAAALVSKPEGLHCLVTLNLYGDILSDEAAALVGGLGFAPSANIGDRYALFEPVHGSAPDIAGQGVANPSGAVLSAAMMLDHLNLPRLGDEIREAVSSTLAQGAFTRDAGGEYGTERFIEVLIKNLR
jgi:isopropylmalate/isohomocitrate dehydrogenase-like protein